MGTGQFCILIIGLWILQASAAKRESRDKSGQCRVPTVHEKLHVKGKSYDDARKELIKFGWRPVPNPEASDEGNAGVFIERE